MSTAPSISFQQVRFAYGTEGVLNDFSFWAKPGQHTVIKGESGSWKSTILKLILGFLTPDSGSITVDNREPGRDIRKQTAWLPPELNIGAGPVREVIGKPFRFNVNEKQMPGEELMQNTFRSLGLSAELFDKNLQDLSTGQRQRVGIALCHLLNKPLLLLDEPTSSLDEESKNKVKQLLLVQASKTVLSTSHDPSWIDAADKVITLN